LSTETVRLEKIAGASPYAAGFNLPSVQYSFRIFSRHFCGDSVLEMGAAEGVMTELLARTGKSLTIVEGSRSFCDSLRQRFPAANVEHALFEEFDPRQTFDNIVLGHVLEHVNEPAAIVARAAKWLSAKGRMLAVVPNSRSLHRQVGVLLGLLPFEEALSEADHRNGHRRVFNPETFRGCFIDAGLKIELFGGYFLKPLSNVQLETTWSPEMLEAFMQLGERYPDIAGDIYVVARHP
jgi:2-polyprenyl-3-methyl-5-hydroxy-6-metoxy-1,4-benzoquinol methylase